MEPKPSKKSLKEDKQSKKDKETYEFVEEKKQEMKKSQYRERFDNLRGEIEVNLVNTFVSYGKKLYEKSGWGSMVFYNKLENGAYDYNIYPQKLTDRDQNYSGAPVSQEPIAFSKILIAAAVLGGKLPDCEVVCDDKVYARASYELWKRTWENRGGNGANCLGLVYQNLFTYGWAAWRTYPRRVQVERNGAPKILFDDIYRVPLDPNRTWLGVGFEVGDYWTQMEVYYERDIPKDDFFTMYPAAIGMTKKKNYLEWTSQEKQTAESETETDTSQEAKDENSEKARTHVTVGYYENPILNKFVVKCGKMIIYDGEMPNDDNYGSVIVVRCFARNLVDPYGVGLYEMMRGNTALYTYINSLNAQQVEAEIMPLIFGNQVQNGSATYRRGPNIINPKAPGSDSLTVVNTNGNVAQGIAYANQQKTNIEENTGVNNIVAGQNTDSTLGSTVIQKEAAFNRLTAPRNSMVDGLGTDADIAHSWIKQTYPVDKVFMINSNTDMQAFVKNNPDYFVQQGTITDDDGNVKGMTALASKNLRLNFDFTPDGELLENVNKRKVSAKQLFSDLAAHGHMVDSIEFIIDPDSMLLPSIEIEKQTFMALFPVITNQITLIFSLRMKDPDAAASQLMTLEQMLLIQRQDIFDFMSKQDYDDILAKKPSQAQIAMQQAAAKPEEKPVSVSVNAKDTPPAVQAAIFAKAGIAPAAAPVAPPAGAAPAQDLGSQTFPAGPGAIEAVPGGNVPRPQGPLTAAVDASLGRAAHTPFFPNHPMRHSKSEK